jgi:hypothetical protein
MPRRYNSFLLRCWVLNDQMRIEIQHIQSGRRVQQSSLPDVLRWLDSINDAPPDGTKRADFDGSRDEHPIEDGASDEILAPLSIIGAQRKGQREGRDSR